MVWMALAGARGLRSHLSDDKTVAKMGHPIVVVRLDVGHPPVFIVKLVGVDTGSTTSNSVDHERRYCRDEENKIYSVGAIRLSMDKTRSVLRCEIGGQWKRINN